MPKVHTQDRGPVRLITLDEPPANTYSYEMMRELDSAILDARFDDNVEAIVLTGAGEKFFCAGADIRMLDDVTPGFKYNFCLHANETLLRLEHTAKPIIAALNGHTVGGGLEVALACDLRFARVGKAKLGAPEVKLGVLPGTGGTARLCRMLGKSKAFALMFDAENISMADALELGIVNRLIESETNDAFVDEVVAYAATLCAPHRAPKAVGLIKRSVQSGGDMALEHHLALERELQQRLFDSEDAKEGISAYNEKRKPQFTGR